MSFIGNTVRLFLQCVSCTLLYICGWQIPRERDFLHIYEQDRIVLVFSHTSIWDFVIFIIMSFSKPEAFENVYCIMKPQPFKRFGTILRKMRFIPSTKRESSNEGFVDSCVKLLEDKPVVHLIISPKGTRSFSELRSGYYWLSKGLNCGIAVTGLDYEKKKLKFSKIYSSEESLIVIDQKIKREFSQIVALHPEHEYCISKAFNSHTVSVIDPLVLTMFISSFACLTYIKLFPTSCIILGCIASFISILYHRTRERSNILRTLDTLMSSISLIVYYIFLIVENKTSIFNAKYLLCIGFTTVIYHLACGREKIQFRTKKYIILHSIFHLLLFPLLVYPVYN